MFLLKEKLHFEFYLYFSLKKFNLLLEASGRPCFFVILAL